MRLDSTHGEWVEPNGKVHDTEDDEHWIWADDYLKSIGGEKRFKDDPQDELLARGWLKIIFVSTEKLIYIINSKPLTKQQKIYIEDQAEETSWKVVNDNGYDVYIPYNYETEENERNYEDDEPPIGEVTQKDIKSVHPTHLNVWNKNKDRSWTPKLKMMTLDNLKALRDKSARGLKYCKETNQLEHIDEYIREWNFYNNEIKRRIQRINDPVEEDHGLGYSHNVSFDDYKKQRDPLNDPDLTGKIKESYKFTDYEFVADREGFNVPTDVRYNTLFLGVITSKPEGYEISMVCGPHKNILTTSKTKQRKFKTKNEAALMLHKMWKHLRQRT